MTPANDLPLNVKALPPAPDDPELEAALNDLDKQADLDMIWQQQQLSQQPPVPNDARPAVLPDGGAHNAPPAPPAAAPAPPSSPAATPPPDQPASSAQDARLPNRAE